MWFVGDEVVCVLCSTENWQQGQTILPEEVNYMLSWLREREITPHTFLWLMSTLGIKLIFHACFEEAELKLLAF